jgi:signal transduction histidine kinase
MITRNTLRKIRLSHRISILFFCCVILPLAVMLGLLFYHLENELKNQSIQRLRHQAKNISLSIYERLLLVENEMRTFLPRDSRPLQDASRLFGSEDIQFQPKRLENLFRLGPQGAVPFLEGRPHFCGVPFSELSSIESEKSLIIKRRCSDGYPHLWMAMRTSNHEWLIGQINADYLWNARSNFNLPGDTELCIVDERKDVLVASDVGAAHLVDALARLNSKESLSGFSWGNGEQEYVASAHSLFLKSGFSADRWEIILSQSQRSILSSVHNFKYIFLLLGFLVMGIVFLLSQVSIRRSLIPLHQLMASAKAIASEDFSCSTVIKGSPEFQELLDAFNFMAKKIEKRVAERTLELKTANQELSNEINQRIRAEENLKQAKESAESATRAKSEFLANMSHEVRTPLNHIIGFTELVVDKHFGGLNADQEEYLTDVLQSSHHLLSLINDILDLSKVEAGKMELKRKEIELRPILENSLIMIKEKALNHGIQLSTRIDGIPDFIQADERKFKQILYNLLSNAVKFTPDGGNICLSADRVDASFLPRGIASSLHGPGDCEQKDGGEQKFVQISVSDNGIGLKKEDIDRIFAPFEQVESSSSRKHQGTGLGLSLTRSLVDLHGGTIWAESEGEGKGSAFRFVIPA